MTFKVYMISPAPSIQNKKNYKLTFEQILPILVHRFRMWPEEKVQFFGGNQMKNKQNSPSSEKDILDPREMFLTVELDEGGEETFQIMKIFEADGQDYIAVCPTDGSEDIYFYRHFEDAAGNPSIGNIESDEEFELVTDAFDQLLDDEEFDQM